MQEIWEDIQGYEGMYQVSNLGKVKSLERYFASNNPKNPIAHINEKILKLTLDKKGYLNAHLIKNGKMKNFQVHRLVAQTFIPNPNDLPQVNHKDENKTNNSVKNLEWCTRKYNCNYGTRNSKIGQFQTKSRIIQCDLSGKTIRIFENGGEAGRFLGKDPSPIYSCCSGKQTTAYGYRWYREGENLVPIKNCCKHILKYDQHWHLVAEYPSMNDCYKENPISPHTLRKYINSRKTFKGFYWELL